MMTTTLPRFEDRALGPALTGLSAELLDRLDFGVIGFDRRTIVCAYNAFEAQAAGLRRTSVIGERFFDTVAPCMNNFMVAERFVEASLLGTSLDALVPYTLTLRMRPTEVVLRLLSEPSADLSYILVQRRG